MVWNVRGKRDGFFLVVAKNTDPKVLNSLSFKL